MRHGRHGRRHNPVGRLMGGLVLIVVGLVFTLDNFDLVDWQVAHFWKFWPLLLIAVGIAKLTRLEERAAGLWMVGIGAWLQLAQLRVWGMDWDTSWPVLLMVVGGILVTLTVLDRMGLVAPREGEQHE